MDKMWHDVTYQWDNPKYRYEVTIDGDAQHVNRKTGEIRYAEIIPGKYTRIGGKGLHRVMITHFKREILPGELVRHLNDNPHDNRLENLAIGTKSDNLHDAYRNKPEYRKKISAALNGKKRSPEACAAISAGNKGKKHTPERIAAISAGMKNKNKGKKQTPEAIAARIEGMRRAKALREAQEKLNTNSPLLKF